MEASQLKATVEAMIFASEEPISEQSIVKLLVEDDVDRASVKEAIQSIYESWNENPSMGIKLEEIAGGYQFRTKELAAEWVKRLFAEKPARLSQAALETLAIVAYRQPIIRSEVEHIRGVDSGGVLKTLLERRLVRIVGKRDEPGQPLIYGTTKEFLELFGLSSLAELPALKDLKELAKRAEESESHQVSDEKRESDDEEPTAVLPRDEDDEGEEESTEIISRLEKDEQIDKQALESLERSIKDLRRLEKDIFPKPAPEVQAGAEGTENVGNETQQQGLQQETNAATGASDKAEENAPEQVDRTVE